MKRLEGKDDRALILDGDWLQAMRWGTEQARVPVMDLEPGEITKEKKWLRVGFGSLQTNVWVPLDAEAEAEAFVKDVNAAIDAAG